MGRGRGREKEIGGGIYIMYIYLCMLVVHRERGVVAMF